MENNLKPEEREVIKLVGFFKKRAVQLLEEGKLPDEYKELIATSDKLVEQINLHAKTRETILSEREQLENLIKDNAQCPKCFSAEKMKLIGTDKSPEGWVSNKYKCRTCNIEFVWNAPNNPWDMIQYVEKIVAGLRQKTEVLPDNEAKKSTETAIAQMEGNIAKLKPIVEASNLDMADLEARDKEMEEVVKKFKKHLQIEKIRIED